MSGTRRSRPAATFDDVLLDVVIRFVEYGEYGTRERALAALARRGGPVAAAERTARFDRAVAILDATVTSVRAAAARLVPGSTTGFSRFEDIDATVVLAESRAAFPDASDDELSRVYGWVVHWHYLR